VQFNLAPQRQLSSTKNRSKLKQRGQHHHRNSTHNRNRILQRTMSTISHDENAKRFTTEVDGHLAQLDYTLAGSVMTITHTRVPQAIGGRGIAADLMRAALRVAETEGWSVNPACSYAAEYMRRHAQERDKEHIDDLLDEALEETFPASDSPSVGGSN
jgi:predicted GNAT family acetyltransferase